MGEFMRLSKLRLTLICTDLCYFIVLKQADYMAFFALSFINFTSITTRILNKIFYSPT